MKAEIPEFGTKRENEERRDGGCGVVYDPESQRYAVNKLTNGLLGLFSGGVDPSEDIKEGILREVVEESGLDDFEYVEKIAEAETHYFNILKNVNRVAHATCFLVILKSRHTVPVKREAHETFSLHWATADEIFKNWESFNENHDHDHWIYFMKKAVARVSELGYDKTTNI